MRALMLLPLLALAQTVSPVTQLNTEHNLVMALVEADYAVELAIANNDQTALANADAQSDAAGAALTNFCTSIQKTVGVKRSGIIGCLPAIVAWPVKVSSQ